MEYPVTQENFTNKITPGVNAMTHIVIHHWGDPAENPQFDNIVNHLAYSAAEVSCHFVAEAGRVSQVARLDQIAWHAMSANTYGIGIENNPQCRPGDVDTLVDVIVDIWNTIGRRLPIIKHSDVVATACPGRYSQLVDNGELYNRAVAAQEGRNMANEYEIAKAVWERTITNMAGVDNQAWEFIQRMDHFVAEQPNRVWDATIENATGLHIPVRGMMKAIDMYTGETRDNIHEMKKQMDRMEGKIDSLLNKK